MTRQNYIEYTVDPLQMQRYRDMKIQLLNYQKRHINRTGLLSTSATLVTTAMFYWRFGLPAGLAVFVLFGSVPAAFYYYIYKKRHQLFSRLDNSHVTVKLSGDTLFNGFEAFLFNPQSFLQKLSHPYYRLGLDKQQKCIQVLRVKGSSQSMDSMAEIYNEVPYTPEHEEEVEALFTLWMSYGRTTMIDPAETDRLRNSPLSAI